MTTARTAPDAQGIGDGRFLPRLAHLPPGRCKSGSLPTRMTGAAWTATRGDIRPLYPRLIAMGGRAARDHATSPFGDRPQRDVSSDRPDQVLSSRCNSGLLSSLRLSGEPNRDACLRESPGLPSGNLPAAATGGRGALCTSGVPSVSS